MVSPKYRYVALEARPAADGHDFDWFKRGLERVDVIQTDRAPIATGLLNAEGRLLYRLPETVPLGFHGRQKAR